MILDSSAIIATIVREPGYEAILDKLATETSPAAGTPTLAESGIVLAGKLGASARTVLSRFLEEHGVVAVPFTDEHWPVALDAFMRYGKGRHPARLNFGDCLTYATAKLAGEPLLALGADFAATDLELAYSG